jgi:hypothetical protein
MEEDTLMRPAVVLLNLILVIMSISLSGFSQENRKPWITPPPPSAPPRPSPEETADLKFNTLFHFLEDPADNSPPQRIAGVAIKGCDVTSAVRFSKSSVYVLDLWERETGATISGFHRNGISAIAHDERVAQEIIKRADLSRRADARIYYTLWVIDRDGKKGYAMVVDYVEWLDENGRVIDHIDQGQRSF